MARGMEGIAGWTRGDLLSTEDQRQVLGDYAYRFTLAHRPQWARAPRPGGRIYRPHFRDDADWLANTWFRTKLDGGLDRRGRKCHSVPTWPQGRE